MILSHKHKFIFICNGKTGTSSIENALGIYQEGSEFEASVDGLYHGKHVPPAVLKSLLGKKTWDNYFKFCFVRNPWDWFVSQYFWNNRPPPVGKRLFVKNPAQWLKRYRSIREKRSQMKEIRQFSAADIHSTYELLRHFRGVYDAQSLFQYNYVYDQDGEQLVDFVGRFERLEEDFGQIMNHLGLSASLPYRNYSSHLRYQDYYNRETIDLVGQLWRVDVEAFGYRFE